MGYINEVHTYVNDKGIELHEEVTVDGKCPAGFNNYAAFVRINVETPDGSIPQQISTRFTAVGYKEAFKKSEKYLNDEIKKFQKKLKEASEQAEKDRLDESAPKIIKPN